MKTLLYFLLLMAVFFRPLWGLLCAPLTWFKRTPKPCLVCRGMGTMCTKCRRDLFQ